MGQRHIYSICALIAAMPMSLRAGSGWDYGKRGLECSVTSSGSYIWLGLRGQLRYLSNHSRFHAPDDLESPKKFDTRMNRSRFKVGARIAHGLEPYQEYDLVGSRLLA